MSRTFAYCRVSTIDQTTVNQTQEIQAAGFAIKAQRVIAETVSGSVPASERKGFSKLLERMEIGDILVVTKLDRLGRNAMDVRSTVEKLANLGIRVHCLALGGVDLCSPAGKMTMSIIAAVAEFERDLLVERTQQGLIRAKAEGRQLGRPKAVHPKQVQRLKDDGMAQKAVAHKLGVSLSTIKRVWNVAE